METQFVIPAKHLKVFAKIVQCMSKIGDDLFFEVANDKLSMRTLNNGRSAFVEIAFTKNFFEYFAVGGDGEHKYQMKAKPCYAVFHNIANAEKCTIRMDEEEHRLIFDIPCKRGIKKTTKLAFEESEPLKAIYSKDQCGTKIVVNPKQLADNLPNFHSNLEEVTIFVGKEGMKIKSFADSTKGGTKKQLQTELQLDFNDFESFVTDGSLDVTFSLKEFKTIISLCEVIGQPCTLLMERSGRPMLITLKYFNLFDAEFVLATLISQQDAPSSQNSSTTSADSASAYSQSPRATPKQKPSPSPAMSPRRSPAASPSGHSGSYAPSPTPMAYDSTQYPSLDHSDTHSGPAQGSLGRRGRQDDNDQDEYVSGSPQSSPKKAQKVELSKMLGGRDLDAEDDYDYEMEDNETVPSSAS